MTHHAPAPCHPNKPKYSLGMCRECWRKEKRRQKIALRNADRVCELCMEPLPVTARGNVKYCSKPCKYKAQNIGTYGLRATDFQELTASGKCPICLNNVKRWHIDHRHSDGKTYGAVCFSCNSFLLAGSRHDIEIAKRLVEFLENPPASRVGEDGDKFVLPTRRNRSKRADSGARRLVYTPLSKKAKEEAA